MRTLKDKRVLITGGASGIGYAIAQRARRRARVVVLTDIDEPLLHRPPSSLRDAGCEVHAVPARRHRPEDVRLGGSASTPTAVRSTSW